MYAVCDDVIYVDAHFMVSILFKEYIVLNKMRYISLFSGIGGFELGIHAVFPNAECIGFSEVDVHALKVYTHHFPNHRNLGDVTKITRDTLKEVVGNEGCDLLVGGFPCQNLTALANHNKNCNSDGLRGPKSGLFHDMVRIIKWIIDLNGSKKLHLVIENNASMKNVYKNEITCTLQRITGNIVCTMLNAADFGVQTRRRLYWTTFPVQKTHIMCVQSWADVLAPLDQCSHYVGDTHILNSGNKKREESKHKMILVKKLGDKEWCFIESEEYGKSNWQVGHIDTEREKSAPITRPFCTFNFVIDRRDKTPGVFAIRHLEVVEIERLFNIPDNWVGSLCSRTRSKLLLGNTVVVNVIKYILKQMFIQSNQVNLPLLD